MILFIHIVIALASVGYTFLAFIHPSKSKLQTSYTLVVLTIVTGSYLVWSKPAHMLSTCVTGLVYVGIITVGIAATKHKLAKQNI